MFFKKFALKLLDAAYFEKLKLLQYYHYNAYFEVKNVKAVNKNQDLETWLYNATRTQIYFTFCSLPQYLISRLLSDVRYNNTLNPLFSYNIQKRQ